MKRLPLKRFISITIKDDYPPCQGQEVRVFPGDKGKSHEKLHSYPLFQFVFCVYAVPGRNFDSKRFILLQNSMLCQLFFPEAIDWNNPVRGYVEIRAL